VVCAAVIALLPALTTSISSVQYRAGRGVPQTGDDMRRHNMLTCSLIGGRPGHLVLLRVYGRMEANDSSTPIGAALAGINQSGRPPSHAPRRDVPQSERKRC